MVTLRMQMSSVDNSLHLTCSSKSSLWVKLPKKLCFLEVNLCFQFYLPVCQIDSRNLAVQQLCQQQTISSCTPLPLIPAAGRRLVYLK